MRDHALVVGGGVCGLMASIELKKYFKKVTLIEQSHELGGLFRSVKDELGNYYDMGSHIPNATNIEPLDELLFGPENVRATRWNIIRKLYSGNYFAGQWDLNSPFANGQRLPESIYRKGCEELIQLTETPNSQFIVEYCQKSLGSTFTNHIVKPILKKLYGHHVNLDTLTMAAGLFGFTRILALSPDVADVLKQLPVFDTKLGYQNEKHFFARLAREAHLQPPHYFYPIDNSGIQSWVDYLEQKARAVGVEIKLNEAVEKIALDNGQVTTVKLASQPQTLDTQLLFWSAPPFIALKAMNLPVVSNKPVLRTALVFHYSVDKPLLDDRSHYLWIWDDSTAIFRVTLYPNLSPESTSHTISAEVLCAPEEAEQYSKEDIFNTLKRLELIALDANCLSSIKQVIHNTFPVPSTEFETGNAENYHTLSENVSNVIVSGRSGGKQWRQADVLVAAYNAIQAFVKAG